jgi:hypothetical protein
MRLNKLDYYIKLTKREKETLELWFKKDSFSF